MQLRCALAKLPLPRPRKVSVCALCSCTSGKERGEVSQHTHCKKRCADQTLTSKRKETGFQDLLHKFSAETLPPKIIRITEVLVIRSRSKYQISGTAREYRTNLMPASHEEVILACFCLALLVWEVNPGFVLSCCSPRFRWRVQMDE